MRNASSNLPVFNIDTVRGIVQIGSSNPEMSEGRVPVMLILDRIAMDGDPEGVDGAMYYNYTMGLFRCHQAGRWVNCIADCVAPACEGEADDDNEDEKREEEEKKLEEERADEEEESGDDGEGED